MKTKEIELILNIAIPGARSNKENHLSFYFVLSQIIKFLKTDYNESQPMVYKMCFTAKNDNIHSIWSRLKQEFK